MRVVHVQRLAGIGGSERHLLTLLPALARLGLDPVFLGLDDPAADPEPFYRQLDARRVPAFGIATPRGHDPMLGRRVARSLRGLRADLVHTHLVHADVYGTLASLETGTPLVSTKHNDDRFRVGPFRYVERALARRARRILAITHALARFCVERVGLPEERLVVVPYGLDDVPRAWGPDVDADVPPDATLLLSVARLAPQKGLDVAVEALPRIRAADPRAVLVVLGEGPERDRLARRAEQLGVADALRLPGRSGDVARWLARADLFVHPARWEGFGLVVLEAMLASLPVVASRVSAIPEIVVDGETGLLVPRDDAGALAQAVAHVLADRPLAERLGAAGRERARAQFSVERMAERTSAVYETALTPARRRRRPARRG